MFMLIESEISGRKTIIPLRDIQSIDETKYGFSIHLASQNSIEIEETSFDKLVKLLEENKLCLSPQA